MPPRHAHNPTPDDKPTKGPATGPKKGAVMSLGDHIEDLRRRLILALLGVVPIIVLAFIFGAPIVELLIRPVQEALREAGMNPTLQSTGVFEMFGAYVRVSLIAAVLVGSPWLLYQLWRFVAPGLYDNERRFVYFLIPLSVSLSTLGIVFLYYVILPVVLGFFIQFGASVGDPKATTAAWPGDVPPAALVAIPGDPEHPEPGQMWINTRLQQLRVALPAAKPANVPPAAQTPADQTDETQVQLAAVEPSEPLATEPLAIQGSPAPGKPAKVRVLGVPLTESAGVVPQYRISEYVKSFLSMALAFGGGFQLPVVILLLGWAGLVRVEWLTKYRRHSMMGCCVVAAVVTPADPLSMVLLAVPLYLLYEFGILLLRLMPPQRVARGFWKQGGVAAAITGRAPHGGPSDGPGGRSGDDSAEESGPNRGNEPILPGAPGRQPGPEGGFSYFDVPKQPLSDDQNGNGDGDDDHVDEHTRIETIDGRPVNEYGEFIRPTGADNDPPEPEHGSNHHGSDQHGSDEHGSDETRPDLDQDDQSDQHGTQGPRDG